MVVTINRVDSQNITAFGALKKGEEQGPKHDMPLKNDFVTKSRIAIDQFTKAFTVYPARGITGNINSDFYEFLTMGTVPYVVGSLTLMGVFNGVRHAFNINQNAKAAKLGNKMSLGVLFYGLFKSFSKGLINYPVKWKTGIDTQLPYLKVYNELPENKDDTDVVSYEYHKVGESVEFTRWDMLYGNPHEGTLNEKFDKIAKKNGLGTNLNDSDSSVKPMYKEVLVKSTLARSFSSYMWAAVGVAMAFQKPWDEFFRSLNNASLFKPQTIGHSIKLFGKDFIKSAKSLYAGDFNSNSKISRYGGKALIGSAIAITLLGLLNTFNITRKPSKLKESDVLDRNKESVVG